MNRHILWVCITCALLLMMGCTSFGHGHNTVSPSTAASTDNTQGKHGGGRGVNGGGG